MPRNKQSAAVRRVWRRAGIGLLLLLCGASATAQVKQKSLADHVATCAACHGAGGNAQLPNMPSIAGQPKVFIEQQLIMIREGLRVVPAMAGVVDGMSDKDVTAIAGHFAAQPVIPSPGPRNDAQFERGRLLAGKMHCASCHQANYEGREQMPRLAGQREDYLVKSMLEFRDGLATGRDTMMAGLLYGVSDQDIGALAHHMAQLK